MSKDREELLQNIFSTFSGIQRLMHARFQRTFEHAKVAPSQLQLLFIIECSQPINLKELASKMYMTPGAITQLIEGLVTEGYIARKQDDNDRRIVYVSLAAEGRKKIAELKKTKQHMFEQVMSSLDDEELRLFLKVQQKMLAYLESSDQNVKK
jgi:DNA-binding MarR family transcriptional regulator